MRAIAAGRTFLLCVFSLAMIQSCSKSDETASEQSVAVDANLESDSFALALPAIPDIAVGAGEARLRILRGPGQLLTESSLECSNKLSVDQKGKANPNLAAIKSLTVSELSLPYKVGQSIGPIKLDVGDFSVLLEIFDRNTLAYFGIARFSVASGVVTKLNLSLQKPQACPKPSGEVVINTIVNKNQVDSGITKLTFEDVFGVVDKSQGFLLGKSEGAFGPIFIASPGLKSLAGDPEEGNFPTDSLQIETHGNGTIFKFAAPVTKVSFDMACLCAAQTTYRVFAAGFEKEIRHSSDKKGTKTRIDLVFPSPVDSFTIQSKNDGPNSSVAIDDLTANLSPTLVYAGPKAAPAPGLLQILPFGSNYSHSREFRDKLRLEIVIYNYGSTAIATDVTIECRAASDRRIVFTDRFQVNLKIHESTSFIRDNLSFGQLLAPHGMMCKLNPVNSDLKSQINSQEVPLQERRF